ncbi:hypothetical protein PITCH_A380005 [uncultured Desulfobacterium sp.]|uniref:Uncharacterized protein n=1 Tax=uncultured Desulfobacterium sp. TaxID=201089 RepID=A0A445MZH2_9BACT|nr:hypothetical protein PITCH_A380005 [uncultured Desulfobacterium sp.]
MVASCDHLEKLKFSNALLFAYTQHGTVMAVREYELNTRGDEQ